MVSSEGHYAYFVHPVLASHTRHGLSLPHSFHLISHRFYTVICMIHRGFGLHSVAGERKRESPELVFTQEELDEM